MDLYDNVDEPIEVENENDSESLFEEGEAEQEPEQEPELEDNEAVVDSPRPTQEKRRRSVRPKKRRRRSSSRESMDECEDGGKAVIPLSSTNKEINVGTEFQAVISEDLDPCYSEHDEDPDEKIWETPEVIDDEKLLNFVSEASDRYRIPIDRALYILTKENFDFGAAIDEIGKRNELRDSWTDDDTTLFFNCFHAFGKNFRRINSAMPHRSITSLVQYYYDSKKRITFKAFADSKHNESSGSEDFEDTSPYPDTMFDGTCENCGEKSERLEMNDAMNRNECRACLIYFDIMNVPRPTCLRLVINERVQNHVSCPTYMRGYMREYEKLMRRSTGSTYKNRKMGKNQTVQDITGANKTPPPGEYEEFVKTDVLEGKSDEIGKEVTRIWKKKHTVCMEEIDVLADDSRRKLFDACISQSRVNIKEVACWKNEMNSMRNRMERMNVDVDLIPSLVLSKGRVRYAQNWTDAEKEDVLRCFQWYGPSFEYVADVMGTKTAEQIAGFYKEHEEVIEASIESYEEEIQKKLAKIPVFEA